MAVSAAVFAALAALLAVLPGIALYLAMAAAILGLGAGLAAYRARASRGSLRLIGAGAASLAGLALILCGVRYGLIVVALGRLERLIG